MSGSKESRQAPAIVVGIDGSNGSSEALRWAIAEARLRKLDITVQADGLGEPELTQAAELAGRYCPVSNTLRIGGAELHVAAHLAAPVVASG